MSTAGYSGTPLIKKLGLNAEMTAMFRHAPAHYADLLVGLPDDLKLVKQFRGVLDFIHLFVTERAVLEEEVQRCLAHLAPTGMIWVSWPKKASKVETDITEDVIREIILPLGLVDVKVCAVDDVWSGLKLVIRKALRKS
jgi:hypothetical protein